LIGLGKIKILYPQKHLISYSNEWKEDKDHKDKTNKQTTKLKHINVILHSTALAW